ncbi:hypothetical protein NDU88_000879 [Pleurodeles waltl]|uniref:Uncharacterized protein n=1 Tax=Pleurodeles waltl TaxID=8319 RepID=A0AAV7Q1K5_PLEWA|nr:hypothetical protein NDU88_000879 [Pleurodeles waltl]
MKGFVSAAFLLLCSLALGEGLQCKQCDYPCLITTTATCGLLQMCDTRTATKGDLKLKAKGCLDAASCLSTETNTILGIEYTVTHSCCVVIMMDLAWKKPNLPDLLTVCSQNQDRPDEGSRE